MQLHQSANDFVTLRSGEAQAILDQLVKIYRRIEAHEAEVWRLRLERQRLRAELDATGYRSGEPEQTELLP
jgi:hypothetical protein